MHWTNLNLISLIIAFVFSFFFLFPSVVKDLCTGLALLQPSSCQMVGIGTTTTRTIIIYCGTNVVIQNIIGGPWVKKPENETTQPTKKKTKQKETYFNLK